MTERLGQRLGNYRLLRLLGRGGFAEVYLGQHVYLKSEAAIKVLSTRLMGADSEGFLAEARTLVALRHPHIVRLLEFGIENDTPFLIMDYAPLGTLRQRYPKGSRLAVPTVVAYIKQLASALQYAHDRKLIHRDIKPENFLLQSEDEIVLSDFGIATTLQSSSYSEKHDFVGTVSYMAPEQIQGRARPASDQYALAVVAYEWLSGEPPFHGSFTEVCTQHVLAPPPPLQQRAPGIPPDVANVVMTALAKDPGQRFASVEAFARALEQAYQPPSSVQGASFVALSSASSAQQEPKVVLPSSGSMPQRPYTYNPFDHHNQTQQDAVQQTPAPPPPQKSLPQRQRLSPGLVVLLSLLIVALLGGGGGLFYYAMVYQPNQMHAVSTATAQAQIQASATAQARTQASATALAQSRATATAEVSATETTPQGLYMIATEGTPALNASLKEQDFNAWDEFTYNGGGGCAFKGGAYHASMPQPGTVALCLAEKTNFSDFAFQVQMTILSGTTGDGGGLIFRSKSGAFYRFRVGTDGSYDLVNQTNGLVSRMNSMIKTGLNQPNLLTVIAQGPHISLYVNKQFITSVDDGASLSGQIGLFAVDFTKPTDVAFSNAQVWKL